eukprot:jgi/Botrbrau1/23436/Bobra.0874s0002.1
MLWRLFCTSPLLIRIGLAECVLCMSSNRHTMSAEQQNIPEQCLFWCFLVLFSGFRGEC